MNFDRYYNVFFGELVAGSNNVLQYGIVRGLGDRNKSSLGFSFMQVFGVFYFQVEEFGETFKV